MCYGVYVFSIVAPVLLLPSCPTSLFVLLMIISLIKQPELCDKLFCHLTGFNVHLFAVQFRFHVHLL